jgi:hypothetical protein
MFPEIQCQVMTSEKISLEAYFFYIEKTSNFRILSADYVSGYALSRVNNRIQSEIYFGNSDWYTKW